MVGAILGVNWGKPSSASAAASPSVLEELALLQAHPEARGRLRRVELRPSHTDCGIRAGAEKLADFLDVRADLDAKMVRSARRSRSTSACAPIPICQRDAPPAVYDVSTGLIENVVPAAP